VNDPGHWQLVAGEERVEAVPCEQPSSRSAGLESVSVEDTDHYRLMREFWSDPGGFVETMLDE
jgi:hypothetical protein